MRIVNHRSILRYLAFANALVSGREGHDAQSATGGLCVFRVQMRRILMRSEIRHELFKQEARLVDVYGAQSCQQLMISGALEVAH